MSMSSLRVASASIGAAASLAANFAPVPYLGPAVGVTIAILKLCDNVKVNKGEVLGLGSRCEGLLYALKDNSSQYAPEKLNLLVETTVELLNDIKQRMVAWATIPTVKQFFLQDQIAEDVKRCNQAITSFLTSFQITSHMEIHSWTASVDDRLSSNHKEVIGFLSDIKNNLEIKSEARNFQPPMVTSVMGNMQNYMGEYNMGDRYHKGLAVNLFGIQQSSGQLLPGIELKHGEVRRTSSHPVGGSAAFDIWQGEYLGSAPCAIKVIRGVEVSPKIRDRFLREVKIWRTMYDLDKGEYILPFWGACLDDGPYPYMVSPWMQYGESLSYVRKFPTVDRRRIIRRIAEGLRLLHSQDPPIAHGDIKAANILIDDKGNPLLADFGLSKIMEEMTGMPFTQSRGISESYRWFAPELCSATGILSPAADIFAYGMTVLELMTDTYPFAHIKRTPQVLIEMQHGVRPNRPVGPVYVERGLDDNLWNLLLRCWDADPQKRPTVHEVLEALS